MTTSGPEAEEGVEAPESSAGTATPAGEADAPESTSTQTTDGEPAADDIATGCVDGVGERDELAAAPAASDESDRNGAAPAVSSRPEPTTMAELLAEQDADIKSFKHGDVVEGTVVRIDKDEILVDIGAKSEGVVSNRELYGRHAETQPQLNIGDIVLVYVLQPESQEGHVVLSLRRAGLERKWRAMQEQFEAGAIIEAPSSITTRAASSSTAASGVSCRSARSSTSRAGRRTTSRATPRRRSPRSSSRSSAGSCG
jgi:predicted RNA-binding protein with RPS1 domain